MQNTLLLFAKVPEPGLVKTRLTAERGGWFSPENAAWLYHCMLFDVAEACCAALDDLEARNPGNSYELVISTTPRENLPAMEELFAKSGAWPRPIRFDFDEGATFDEHYNGAFEKCWARGSDAVVSVGADLPALTKADIVRAFETLRVSVEDGSPAVVIAPDQELGVSLIGWTRGAAFDHTGVYYPPEGLTALPAYVRKAKAAGLPLRYLPPVPDVDTMADLMHAATVVETLVYCAESGDDVVPPWRTADALTRLGVADPRIAPNNLIDPRTQIDK